MDNMQFNRRQWTRKGRSLMQQSLAAAPDTYVLPFSRRQQHHEHDDEPSSTFHSGDREASSNPTQSYATSTTTSGGGGDRDPPSSFGTSTGTSAAEQGPARLFHILEEGLRLMPREGDSESGENRSLLHHVEVQRRRDLAENVWDVVRQWLARYPSPRSRRAAAYIRSQISQVTTLHLMCKIPYPPADLILAMVTAAPEIASWPDAQHGWLPLHNAAANYFVSSEVMEILVHACPQARVTQDSQNRTPLHFYVTTCASNATQRVEIAQLLSETGAAALFDRLGMYPMHYAAAYGADPAVLKVLMQVHASSLTVTEAKGRTPLHLAMVNSHREGMPDVLRFFLNHARKTINSRDQYGFLPLHLLALCLQKQASKSYCEVKRANVAECLGLYLEAKPVAYADFLSAIQDLPHWLQDSAMTSQHVRNVLNEKIAHPFPASILLLDFYMLIMIISCFGRASENHIDIRFNANVRKETESEVVCLLLGGCYFLLRQLVLIFSSLQMGSFRGLASLKTWCFDAQNWLDVATVFLVFYFGGQMLGTESNNTAETFRAGAAYTQGILYLNVIVHLQSTYVDFAVFVGGVLHVVQRLSAFITAVIIILVAFAQMFHFTYSDTFLCPPDVGMNITCKSEGYFDEDENFPHCTFARRLQIQ